MFRFFLSAVTCFWFVSCSSVQPETSYCDILENPTRYEDQPVTFAGIVVYDDGLKIFTLEPCKSQKNSYPAILDNVLRDPIFLESRERSDQTKQYGVAMTIQGMLSDGDLNATHALQGHQFVIHKYWNQRIVDVGDAYTRLGEEPPRPSPDVNN